MHRTRPNPLALVLLALPLVTAPRPAAAQTVIKLASSAPAGSSYEQALKTAAAQWSQISGGKVTLQLYGNGSMGSEQDQLKKLGLGQIQAAAVSTVALRNTVPDPLALDLPRMRTGLSPAARTCTLQSVAPAIEKAVAAKGLVVLAWVDLGQTWFFTREPAITISELKKHKLFVLSGDAPAHQAWSGAGFTTVPLTPADLMPAFQSGLISAAALAPPTAIALGLGGKRVTDLPLSTLTAAIVIDAKAWAAIPADLQLKLKGAMTTIAAKVSSAAGETEAKAFGALKTKGTALVTPTDLAGWQKGLAPLGEGPAVRGALVPAATFDAVKAAVASCKAANP